MMKHCLLLWGLLLAHVLVVQADEFDQQPDAMPDTVDIIADEPAGDDAFASDASDVPSAIAPPAAPSASTALPADDRFEAMNRRVSAFNDTLDAWFLKPVAQGYDFITPGIVNNGISNIFSNIGELPNALNALLQAKPIGISNSLFRFLINSTAGVLGFFDVATAIGIEEDKEDFGQTLAVWGVPSGPYVVLPFLGPSTVRDAHALVLDGFASPLNEINDWPTYLGVWSLKVVDKRADLLEAEKMISGDRYLFLKNAYLQNRHYLENDGNVIDSFDNGGLDDDADWLE